MKHFILTLGLVAISTIGYGQDTNSVSYPKYEEMLSKYWGMELAPDVNFSTKRPYTFFQPETEIDAALGLKNGSMYLLKAHSNRLASASFMMLGTLIMISENNNYDNPNHVFFSPSGEGPKYVVSTLLFTSAAAIGINSLIQERKGLERLYLGADGITIKLN